MLIVGTDEGIVERDLVGGRLGCPGCGGGLGPWGHARRRELRGPEGQVSVRPRRARCRSCRASHVLLGDSWLVRRRDDAARIVTALLARAKGHGYRRIAPTVAMSELASTVRGWLRAFARAAEVLRAHFTRWAHALDPDLGTIVAAGGSVADAVEAMGMAVRAAVQRFGPVPMGAAVSRLSGGALLCNTSCPLPAPPGV